MLDQVGALLLDDEGAGAKRRVFVRLVLLDDGLDRLGLDARLRRIVDTAWQVAVRMHDGLGRKNSGEQRSSASSASTRSTAIS